MRFINSSLVLLVSASVLLSTGHAFTPVSRSGVRSGKSSLCMSAALIVQNKGGGHGELGFQLAKTLTDHPKISSITILQDDACKDSSEPFCSYATDIPNVKIVKAPLSSDDSMTADAMKELLGGASFDYVWDNASKKPEGAGKAICDCAKEWGVKLYTYVSSAGMYQNPTQFPMPETTPIKDSAGQAKQDQYAVDLGLPLVSFRPQYIYGPKSNKHDYIDWYFDRLVRDLPLPIPADGTQKVSLTNAEDVASLLASVLNDEQAAVSQRFFNCGTDQLHTYTDVAMMCAEAAGKDPASVNIELYDADLFGKATFPFRMTDFYVAPDMAKQTLGWTGPKHSLQGDLTDYYQSYVARGGPTKQMSLVKDWEIVFGSTSQFAVRSVYDQYDPLVIDTSEVNQ
ncbi:NAD dependent epimerase/dehydratase family [Seminavis robusta]|uniref:NAD dependent epimerase/dehydratase family n=1 Tax=Seminavis robusta TaxID=568900 RepID=A0A9N8HUQ7_9STRA|nr:NAD dependent epimerase/dehydratase family [Seminavis robusta]|eukprot:Sro2140_g316190.1 NAD dependent epimerase/dehydratase family (398) ;mRNA; r:7553-8938